MKRIPIVIYFILACLIMGPLLLPGYILTMDMNFVPHPALPTTVTSSYLFHALLSVLSAVVAMDWLQKIILLVIFTMAGYGAHHLLEYVFTRLQKQSPPAWLPYIAGLFYTINPFVYERLMAGQYAVLLGYACLPFVVWVLLVLVEKPTIKRAGMVAGLLVIVSIVSIHTLGPIAVLAAAGIIGGLWRQKFQRQYTQKLLGSVAITVVGFALLSSYWLVPLAAGQGSMAAAIDQFSVADRSAFATTGSNAFEALGNLLHLQGFWAEGRDLFTAPQTMVPLWGLLWLFVLATIGAGAWWLYKRQKFIPLFFGVSALVALYLALGTTHGALSFVNNFLTVHLPLFAGYREPQKFMMIVALVYALCFALGSYALLQKVKQQNIRQAAAVGFLGLPLIITPTMLLGCLGQLHSNPYPDDWLTVKSMLNNQPPSTKTLFLPWHQYMYLGMADRIVAVPSQEFFGTRIIASHDPELGNLGSDSAYPLSAAVQTQLLSHLADADANNLLRHFNVDSIVLAKENDYQIYDFLNHNPDLTRAYDGDDMTLYILKNTKEQP